MQTINCILIDDEKSSIDTLCYDLNRVSNTINIMGTFTDPLEGLKAIRTLNPDVVFLDIQMPNLDGFELLDILGGSINFNVVFVTAFEEYAVRAFDYFAIDYLLKPVERQKLEMCLEKLHSANKPPNSDALQAATGLYKEKKRVSDRMTLHLGTKFLIIDIDDIIRCQSDSNYTEFYLANKQRYVSSKPLKFYDDLLAPNGFMRVHRSHLVNPLYFNSFDRSDGGVLRLKDESEIYVSKMKKAMVTQYFKDIKG